jgi:hypothetical protein
MSSTVMMFGWLSGGRAGFLLEAGAALRVGAEPGRQRLERDVAVEAPVAGAVHLAHAARAEGGDDLVGAEPRVRCESHSVGRGATQPTTRRTPAGWLQASATDDAALEEWIVHEPVGCLIEDRFPELAATIEPASDVAEARLYFTSARSDAETWYWIGMTATGSRFVGRLPKPRTAASPVRYRIEARRTDGRIASTKRHAAVVAASESQCPAGVRIAPSAASADAVVVRGSTPRR